MGTELAVIVIPLPDLSRPQTPSLPAWAKRSLDALRTETQKIGAEFKDEVKVLPPALIPTSGQRAAIERHLLNLNSSLSETPENSEEWAAKTGAVATKLLLALGGEKRDALAAEAKGEAYAAALEDIPWWAVAAAARRWYRGDCGKDEQGRPYDYRWPPDPATLKRLATQQMWTVKAQVMDLQSVLDARPYVDCSGEYAAFCERGSAAMQTVYRMISAGEAEKLKGMSIDEAAELGRAAMLAKPQSEAIP